MNREKQVELAKKFKALHEGKGTLLMPYAWNGGSARIYEKEGYEALCTTSAGIAYSMGYPDGEMVSFDDVVRITREIVNVVNIPVSVDMELGYGKTLEEIKANVRRVIEAGAVGINIEDGYPGEKPYLEKLDDQLNKIKAITELRNEIKIPFFINARTCVYWLGIGDEKFSMEEAVKRGNAFLKAGADCVFIPGKIGMEVAETLVKQIEGPVNLIVNPSLKNIVELEEVGIKRLCMGSGPTRVAFEGIINVAKEFKKNDVDRMLDTGFSYHGANKYFEVE